MNKKYNTKLIVFMIIILVILSIIIIALSFYKFKIQDKQDSKKLFYSLTNRKVVKNCINDTCPIGAESHYYNLELEYNIDDINNIVKKMNNDTKKLYEETINSTIEDEECSAVRETYIHRYINSLIYHNYENDKYISLAVDRFKYDACLNKTEAYIYDKQKKEIITQEQLKQQEQVNDVDVIQAINKSLSSYYKEMNLPEIYKDSYDYILFYAFNGDLSVSYQIPDTEIYYNTIVYKKTENDK